MKPPETATVRHLRQQTTGLSLASAPLRAGARWPSQRSRLAIGAVLTLSVLAFAALAPTMPAADFSEWRTRQEVAVPDAGIIKLRLPVETLDTAQPGLEDLRILNPAGAEVPYMLERPQAAGKLVRPPKSFVVELKNNSTVITIETGFNQPLAAVRLETPARDFIKAVQTEGSMDQRTWRVLAEGQPVFRREGVSQMRLPLTGAWNHVRLTVNDARSDSIPFTGAILESVEGPAGTNESSAVSITERAENPGQTRLALNLGAANLDLVSLRFETSEPLFARQIALAVRQVSENTVREQIIGEGAIYRLQVEGQPASASLEIPVERLIPSRELIVLIQNNDSPPLPVSAVSARCRPVYAVFMARQRGSFAVLTGNKRVAAPRYDLSTLGPSLRNLPVPPRLPGRLVPNPNFRAPETLPEIADTGAAIDVTAWRFRKLIQPPAAGVQEVELDLEVLARAQPGFGDLRLVRDGRQVPYVLEHTSITRPVSVQVTSLYDPKKPTASRWSLKLPREGLPVTRLVCTANTPLFRRDLRLYEVPSDDRGQSYESDLGHASWIQTPERKANQFSIDLSGRPASDTLFLETDNGDNPSLALSNFSFYHPVTRLWFKSSSAPLYLYYGNREAASPSYDLSLVAPQVLAAEKVLVPTGPEERLKKGAGGEYAAGAIGSFVFWGILGLVIVALLFLMARLLPREDKPSGAGTPP